MNKKRTISIKNPKLQRIRNNLRKVLHLAIHRELEKMFNSMKQVDRSTKEGLSKYHELLHMEGYLNSLMKKSTIICPSCNFGIDRDVRYNPYVKAWYCVNCYDGIRDAYYELAAKKKRGEWIGGDTNLEFGRTFTK